MRGVALVLAIALSLISASLAVAQEHVLVVVDTTEPKLAATDEDDVWTTDVDMTNLTNASWHLSAQPGALGDRDCRLELSEKLLPPAQTTAVEVTIPGTCAFAGERFEFEIDGDETATPAGPSPVSILFAAGPKPESSTGEPWLAGLVLLPLGLLAALWLWWARRRTA